MNVTELRPGNYFIDEGNLYQVMDILLNKTAMRKMVAKVKAKNMRTGAITELARNSGYDVEKAVLSKKKMAYLYDDGDNLIFMDNSTFEQIGIAKSRFFLFPSTSKILCHLREFPETMIHSRLSNRWIKECSKFLECRLRMIQSYLCDFCQRSR